MKIYFGFNDIRPDGMGSAAINLLTALRNEGIAAQPVHPWKKVLIPEYMQFNPVFLTDTEDEPPLKEVMRRMVDSINNDTECTHFSHFGSTNWGAVVPYLRPDIKVIVSVHCTTPSGSKIAMANKERTNAFIAVSWEVQNKLKRWLPKTRHSQIALIPNAIDVKKYPIHDFRRESKEIRILFFGRIEDYTKGCNRIPAIAKLLKNKGLCFSWDFYGYFHWGYENRFAALNKAYGVESVIHYCGCLQPHEIPAVISQYDIMVMPSNHEGLPIALLEAMACGLACVGSRLRNVTDRVAQDGESAFLIEKNDIKGFANSIYRLGMDKELRMRVGAAARRRVEEQFDLVAHGRRYREVLERTLNDTACDVEQKLLDVDHFEMPNSLKPHLLARIIPIAIKRFLKKYL